MTTDATDRMARAVVDMITTTVMAQHAVSGMDGPAIMVWRFRDAPARLRGLSRHGGDEDWLAVIPAGWDVPEWMLTGTEFGCCEVSAHDLADGSTVCIGAHS